MEQPYSPFKMYPGRQFGYEMVAGGRACHPQKGANFGGRPVLFVMVVVRGHSKNSHTWPPSTADFSPSLQLIGRCVELSCAATGKIRHVV